MKDEGFFLSSRQSQRDEEHVEQLYADEGHQYATDSVDEQVAPQYCRCTERLVSDPPEGQRYPSDDDDGVKITAARIADCGVASRMTFKAAS